MREQRRRIGLPKKIPNKLFPSPLFSARVFENFDSCLAVIMEQAKVFVCTYLRKCCFRAWTKQDVTSAAFKLSPKWEGRGMK